ncbi:hypothetical protein GCM10010121_061060 [Streptomyces brasiliensis]|uniref:Uncharacterized protein n=1 Tax=Streptomyces brasiliensis TaxID=1954 RepID=A0A917L3W9_9ACTN|nr:hypothetical protein GCM10010121_061060 [Streptomyces brasiliensis]
MRVSSRAIQPPETPGTRGHPEHLGVDDGARVGTEARSGPSPSRVIGRGQKAAAESAEDPSSPDCEPAVPGVSRFTPYSLDGAIGGL